MNWLRIIDAKPLFFKIISGQMFSNSLLGSVRDSFQRRWDEGKTGMVDVQLVRFSNTIHSTRTIYLYTAETVFMMRKDLKQKQNVLGRWSLSHFKPEKNILKINPSKLRFVVRWMKKKSNNNTLWIINQSISLAFYNYYYTIVYYFFFQNVLCSLTIISGDT